MFEGTAVDAANDWSEIPLIELTHGMAAITARFAEARLLLTPHAA